MKLIFVYLVACFSVPVWSLYEDQIGKFDWLHRGLGSVHLVEFDLGSSSEGGPAKRIAVATTHNVLAVLNANKNGEILWRQVLEEGDEGTVESILLSGSEVSIVTGNPPLLRSFDLNKAALIKEIPMAMSFKPTESYGKRLVSHADGVITVVHLTEGAVEVNVFNSATGALQWQHALLQPWISPDVQCALTTPSLVCVSASLGRVFSLPLSDPGTGGRDSKDNLFISTNLETLGVHLLDADSSEGGEGSGAGDQTCSHLHVPLTLQHVHGSHQHLLLKWQRGSVLLLCAADGDVLVVQQVGAAPLAISVAPDGTLYKAVQDKQAVRISAVSPSSGSELVSLGLSCSVPLSGEAVAGVRLLAVQQYSRRGDGELAARALLVLDDDSIHAVAASGVLWSREEALSSVLAVEAVDLPVPASSMSMYDHVAQRSGLLYSLRQRVSHQLHEILLWVGDALEGSLSGGDGGAAAADAAPALNRDEFNLHKLLVVATAPGKIFALDNLSGGVVWSAYLPSVRPLPSHKMLLFLQRSVAHFPHPPQMALVAMQKGNCNGVLYTFNPLTGEAVAGGLQLLPCPVNQAAMLAQNDNQFIKPVLVVSSALSVHVFPASAEATVVLPHKDVLYVTTRTDTHLAGYSLRSSAPGALSLSLVWRSHFPPGRITAVHAKRPGDRVHSSGRVMADRSVLYKYTNPNLAVVVSRGQEGGVKNAMSVYLVDLVSGAVVDWVTHSPVSGPVHVVHTENWALYTYHNDRARRHEVYSLELFEGPSQSNASAFSSLSPPLQPRVERQAFLLPAGVRAAAHTVTERSITSKHVLLALETGAIAQVARWFVDPRRPLTGSGPREEGLIPYAPEIPLPPTEVLNYNLSLPRVTAIHTAPAGLESTSIVFVYGLDLFSSRVFPSKMFDMLKDDFDYFLIVAVLLSLTVAAAVTRKLAQRKALFQLWK